MDVGKAVKFVNEDEAWVSKLLIGVVLTFFSFLLLPIPLLEGYVIGIARNVVNGEKRPLPEWGGDWGKLFMDGLYVLIAQFVYTLPFLIILCIGVIASGAFAAIGDASEELVATGFFATFGVAACLGILWFLVLVVVSPAIFIQYVRTNDFGACFRFAEIFAIARDNIADILITVVVAIAAGVVIGLVNTVLNVIPCIGTIIGLVVSALAGPWIMFTIGHLYGQIAAKGNNLKKAF